MFITTNANRKLIIHNGRLQMFQIEQSGDWFRIVHETKRIVLGEPHPTRKSAQAELHRLGEIAIRATAPKRESPEIAGFLGAP